MARKVKNQNQFTIDTMVAMNGQPATEVIAALADGMGITLSYARVYYKWALKNDKAPGLPVEATARKARASKPKLVKARTDRSALKVVAPVTDKTVEELNDIKAKNLARLKAIGAKYQPVKKVVNGATTASDEEQLPSFKNPAFLTADEVKSLI